MCYIFAIISPNMIHLQNMPSSNYLEDQACLSAQERSNLSLENRGQQALQTFLISSK